MDELTHLTNYFKESSRVLRTHGTREKVVTKCVKSVKCVKARIIIGGRFSRRNERTVPLLRASCRIRTNDPEITNHVLWPTELKRRVGSYLHRAATTKYPCCVPTLGDSEGAGRTGLPMC